MSSVATALKCPICLDTCVDPVAPPCGHITCHSCIRLHILASPHPFLATCPTCRDVFATVMPDLDVIPLEYHAFIYPPLRFIDLADGNDHAQEAIDLLKHENSILRDCVANLKSQKAYVTKHWLASRSTVERLKVDERNARLEVEMLKDELEETCLSADPVNVEAYLALEMEKEKVRFANERLEELRAGHDAPGLRWARGEDSPAGAGVKRTSGKAAFRTPSKKKKNTTLSSGGFNVRGIRWLLDRV